MAKEKYNVEVTTFSVDFNKLHDMCQKKKFQASENLFNKLQFE